MRPQAHHQSSVATLARQAIATYTTTDDLLLDPICGSGDILVEAVRAGRMAIGVEHEPYWADMARTRIERATDSGRGGFAAAVNSSVGALIRLLVDEAQPASMVLTAPQAGTTMVSNGKETASDLDELIEGLVSAVSHCAQVMHSLGHYGIVCWPTPRINLPSVFEEAFATARFALIDCHTAPSSDVKLLLFKRLDPFARTTTGQS